MIEASSELIRSLIDLFELDLMRTEPQPADPGEVGRWSAQRKYLQVQLARFHAELRRRQQERANEIPHI